MKNVYDTTDPNVLLRLRRQEAETVLDVIRSFNDPRLKTEQIFLIAKNTLLAQIGVKKMKFIFRTETGLRHGPEVGFAPMPEAIWAELPVTIGVKKVTAEKFPLFHQACVEYIVPITFQNKIGAWFLISDFAQSEMEAENDLIFIETIGNILSAAIENRQLVRDMVAQTSLQRELEVAERIQRQLLTHDFDIIPGSEIHALNIAHHHIGGDFFDVIPRGDKGFFVAIADVSGKGVGAALLMANLQAHLRAQLITHDTLEEVIAKMHQILIKITQGDQFVTLFLAYINTNYRIIEYINCGHNPPLLLSNGKVERLTRGTVPLGIIDLPTVELGEVSYQHGDLLVLYTDGLVDQHNAAGELLGEELVLETVMLHKEASSKNLVDELVKLHKGHAAGMPVDDDVTLMAIRLKL
jgi:phosphoserine phosphatase RsbU/P